MFTAARLCKRACTTEEKKVPSGTGRWHCKASGGINSSGGGRCHGKAPSGVGDGCSGRKTGVERQMHANLLLVLSRVWVSAVIRLLPAYPMLPNCEARVFVLWRCRKLSTPACWWERNAVAQLGSSAASMQSKLVSAGQCTSAPLPSSHSRRKTCAPSSRCLPAAYARGPSAVAAPGPCSVGGDRRGGRAASGEEQQQAVHAGSNESLQIAYGKHANQGHGSCMLMQLGCPAAPTPSPNLQVVAHGAGQHRLEEVVHVCQRGGRALASAPCVLCLARRELLSGRRAPGFGKAPSWPTSAATRTWPLATTMEHSPAAHCRRCPRTGPRCSPEGGRRRGQHKAAVDKKLTCSSTAHKLASCVRCRHTPAPAATHQHVLGGEVPQAAAQRHKHTAIQHVGQPVQQLLHLLHDAHQLHRGRGLGWVEV